VVDALKYMTNKGQVGISPCIIKQRKIKSLLKEPH